MISLRFSCPLNYFSEYGKLEGIVIKLHELTDVPCVEHLIKTNNLKKIVTVKYDSIFHVCEAIIKLPPEDEMIFWLKYSNIYGVAYIEDRNEIQTSNTV